MADSVFTLRTKSGFLRLAARLPGHPGLWLAWGIIGLAVLAALWPQLFTGLDPVQGTAGAALQAPGAHSRLGTDQLGRDLYTRIVYGAFWSLSSALLATGLGLVAGGALGMFAGLSPPRGESLIMRLTDVLLAIPALLLSLSVIILLGPGTFHAAMAVGVASVASFARLARSEVVRIRQAEFIEAARGSGGRFFPIFWRHVLPNTLPTLLAWSALQFGQAILSLATLSFLGFGSPPPVPEWGLMIAEGRNYLSTAWWLTFFPGLMVIAVVLASNRISRSFSGA